MSEGTVRERRSEVKSSEYKHRYKEYPLEPRVQAYRPDYQPVHTDTSMETTTTNKLDFKEHPLEKRAPLKPASGNLRPEGDYDFTSSYTNTFLGRTGERTQPIRHDKKREELGRFEGMPSYKEDFQDWPLPPRRRHEPARWDPPTETFGGSSTMQRDFPEHNVSPRSQHKRQDDWRPPAEPFPDATGYRAEFLEKPLPKKEKRARPEYQAPSVPFGTVSTKQSDFTGPYQPKRASFKPNQAAVTSDEPFQSATTNKSDFVEKPMEARYVHAAQPYVKPEGRMDLSTTNQHEFKDLPLSRHVIEKPGSSGVLRGSGPMAGQSTHAADFIEREARRREMLKPKNNYEAPKERFEGQSTAKGDYTTKQLTPREPFRPKWEPLASDSPFQDATENRAAFVQQPLPPRHVRGKEQFVAPAVPFQASTTTKDSYLGEFQPKRASFKPDAVPMQSEARFEGSTTSKDSYQEQPLPPRYQHQHARYEKPEGAMDLRTSNQDSFREHRAARHTITKPGSSNVLWGQGRFQDKSSYSGDFVEPPRQARQLIKPKNEYEPSKDRFEGLSTTKAAYTGAYAPRQASFRPTNRPLQDLNGFEDNIRPRARWADGPSHVPPMSV